MILLPVLYLFSLPSTRSPQPDHLPRRKGRHCETLQPSLQLPRRQSLRSLLGSRSDGGRVPASQFGDANARDGERCESHLPSTRRHKLGLISSPSSSSFPPETHQPVPQGPFLLSPPFFLPLLKSSNQVSSPSNSRLEPLYLIILTLSFFTPEEQPRRSLSLPSKSRMPSPMPSPGRGSSSFSLRIIRPFFRERERGGEEPDDGPLAFASESVFDLVGFDDDLFR